MQLERPGSINLTFGSIYKKKQSLYPWPDFFGVQNQQKMTEYYIERKTAFASIFFNTTFRIFCYSLVKRLHMYI